jgi:hypothetical protein
VTGLISETTVAERKQAVSVATRYRMISGGHVPCALFAARKFTIAFSISTHTLMSNMDLYGKCN